MPELPEVREKFVADTSGYSRPLREAADQADKFSRQNDQAALAARRMGLAAKEAADKAARAQKDAADAAEKLARGELKADEAAQAAAKAERELERASIAAAAAQRATADAADKAARAQKELARQAALGAAAEDLAMLRASGSVRDHNALLMRLRHDFPDLEKDASGAFVAMTSASRNFGKGLDGLTSSLEDLSGLGKAAPSAILVGLQLLPFAATAAGDAVTLGLGGALTGLALKAQSSNKQVQDSFSATKKHIVSEFQQITTPFHGVLLTISKDARTAFDSMEPALADTFKRMAPAVSNFSHEAAASLRELNPAIESVGNGFARVLATLGPRMPAIMNNLGTSIKAITDAAAANPEALAGLIEDVSKLARYTGDTIGVLIRFSSELKLAAETANAFAIGPIGDVALGILKVKDAFDGASKSTLAIGQGSFPTFAQQAIVAAAGARQLMTAQQAATLSSQQLKSALDALTGANTNAFAATTEYKQALLAANAQAKASNAGIHGNSAAAVANRQALLNLSSAIKNVMQNANPTAGAIERMRQKFIASAVNMGVSRAEARKLADQLLGVKRAAESVPSSRKGPTFHDNAMTVKQHIAALQASINQLHGKTVTVNYIETVHRTLQAERARADGGYVGLAEGGMPRRQFPSGGRVRGPGTTTSDSIPAMLSNGEYVINAEQTARYLPLLDAINYKLDGFATGGYAKGGKPKPPTKAQKAHAAATIARAKARPEYLAALAAQQALASMRASIYGGFFRGGSASLGSAHGSVVQHVYNVNVTVQGSVTAERDLAKAVQRQLITNRMPTSLPAGR